MSASRVVNIGLVQLCMDNDLEANLAAAVAGVRAAAAQGAQIICLPELFRSRYFCQSEEHMHFALAEPVPGPSTEVFGALARELGVVIIASLVEHRSGIMIKPLGALLEEAGNNHYAQLVGQGTEQLGARARNRFGQGEVGVILVLAEVERAEELGQTDDLGTLGGSGAHASGGGSGIGRQVGAHGQLHQADSDGPGRAHWFLQYATAAASLCQFPSGSLRSWPSRIELSASRPAR